MRRFFQFPYLFFFCIVFIALHFCFLFFILVKARHLPNQFLHRNVAVVGKIQAYLNFSTGFQQYLVETEKICIPEQCIVVKKKLKLSVFDASQPILDLGKRYYFFTRLKALPYYQDPGIINAARLGFWRGINFVAYQKRSYPIRLAKNQDSFSLKNITFRLSQQIQVYLSAQDNAIVQSIVLGIKAWMTPDLQQLFQATGLSHLFAISGLHLSLVFFFVGSIFSLFWRLAGLSLYVPAQQAAVLWALLFSFLYFLLSGMHLTAFRAFNFCLFFTATRFLTHYYLPACILIFAFIFHLMIEPTAIFEPGFWFSYMAVFIIYWLIFGRKQQKNWQRYFLLQIGILIGTAVLIFNYFQQFSRVALLANLLAIPFFSFFILPLSFLGALSPFHGLAACFFYLDHLCIVILLKYLHFLVAIPHAVYTQALPASGFLFFLLGGIACLAPRIFKLQAFAVIVVLIFFYYKPKSPPLGSFSASILDVGQGLSVLIRTQQHVLLYDLGPIFPNGHSATAMVVVPYLRQQRIETIDRLIISHQDADHRGDSHYLLKQFLVKRIMTSALSFFPQAKPCLAGMHWEWDGVRFQILAPTVIHRNWTHNENSCVLKISTGSHSLLLTGDLEAKAERKLIQREKDLLSATVLLLGHHGSGTSSSTAFLKAIFPSLALISSGRDNQYHLPSQKVLARLSKMHIVYKDTQSVGFIYLFFQKNGVRF